MANNHIQMTTMATNNSGKDIKMNLQDQQSELSQRDYIPSIT